MPHSAPITSFILRWSRQMAGSKWTLSDCSDMLGGQRHVLIRFLHHTLFFFRHSYDCTWRLPSLKPSRVSSYLLINEDPLVWQENTRADCMSTGPHSRKGKKKQSSP